MDSTFGALQSDMPPIDTFGGHDRAGDPYVRFTDSLLASLILSHKRDLGNLGLPDPTSEQILRVQHLAGRLTAEHGTTLIAFLRREKYHSNGWRAPRAILGSLTVHMQPDLASYVSESLAHM